MALFILHSCRTVQNAESEADDLVTVCPNCGSQIESKPTSQDASLETEDTPSPPPKVSRPKPHHLLQRSISQRDPRPRLLRQSCLSLEEHSWSSFGLPYLIGALSGRSYHNLHDEYNTYHRDKLYDGHLYFLHHLYYEFSQFSSGTVGIPYLLAGIASSVCWLWISQKNDGRLPHRAGGVDIRQLSNSSCLYHLSNLAIGAATLYFQTRPPVRAWLKGTIPAVVETEEGITDSSI